MTWRQARWDHQSVFELSGGSDHALGAGSVDDLVPNGMTRDRLDLPSAPEFEVVRHFVNLSQMNYCLDNGLYPLGSCTMKFNPKYADRLAAHPKAAQVHPLQDEASMQGSLRIMHELERMLCVIGGVDAMTLQPPSGAQGEFTGMLIAKAYHTLRDDPRDEVIVPDTAHGTNPASAMMAGFKVVEIPSLPDGCVDLDALDAALSDRTAAMMITNPNTLGIFEPRIDLMAEMVQDAGGLMYYDGANLNAIMGYASPGDMGFDIVHFNLHKTFATPHGGGGPGAGPVGVKAPLEPFLPVPRVMLDEGRYRLDYQRPQSIGKVASFYGNFEVLLRAYTYILRQGSNGLRDASSQAVLNSNYLKKRLMEGYELPFKELRKHEFVLSAASFKDRGVRALDVSKRILDFGMHAPTMYFPLIVDEAMMVEPTESASKEELDRYADVLLSILDENASVLATAPSNTAASRIDEVLAAKRPVYSWRMRPDP